MSNIPAQGVIFWPVGTGDSTTVVVSDETFVQVDLRDLAAADDDDAIVSAVNDQLVEILPERDGRPYLAAFVLTHADKDHCLGFADLLEKVQIGELWATPRLWRELEDGQEGLCPDAVAFQEETVRRVDATLAAAKVGSKAASGDRVRVFGYDTDSSSHAYSELPDGCLSYPGEAVTMIDGEDVSDAFEAFIHAPFKDDCSADRNTTSLAMQVTLKNPGCPDGRILFLGDLTHETIRKIFDYSESHDRSERVEWDLLLAPHHCSKRSLYERVAGQEVLQTDVVDALERRGSESSRVIISSGAFPQADVENANPPHILARGRYEEIASEVLVTAEFPDPDSAVPIAFLLTTAGLALLDDDADGEADARRFDSALAAGGLLGAFLVTGAVYRRLKKRDGTDALREATTISRGQEAKPAQPVTFGAG